MLKNIIQRNYGRIKKTKTIRIVFEADCYAEGETYQEAYNNWLDMDVFSAKSNADFCNLICIEDAETYDDITNEIDK